MIGEIENIKKGLVVATVEYDTSKKIIGVSTSNLVPGPNGIAPLEKQGAFQTPTVAETIDFVQAINNTQQLAEEPTGQVELSVLDVPTNNIELKAPVASDVISENPIQVENPSNLTGFDMPSIEPVQEEVQEEVPTELVAIDIQMPEMPSVVVADEPTGLNESLFEGTESQPSTSILEEQSPVQEAPQAVEMPQVNIEMPTIPVEPAVQEPVEVQTEQQPSVLPAVENTLESIPTTTASEEIPTFDIQMPAVDVNVQAEEPTPQPVEPAVEVQTEVQPEEIVEESQPAIEPQPEQKEAIDVSELRDEAINLYKESMEEIIANFNKAQLEILKTFSDTMNKIKEIEIKEINKLKENKQEHKVVENPIVPSVQEQAPVETMPQQTQASPVPGNPLESAAFEIIDAMSAPKM